MCLIDRLLTKVDVGQAHVRAVVEVIGGDFERFES
jgi:hypothetical protein